MSNNTTPSRGNGLADTPEEELLLLHVALGVFGVVVASAAVWWLKGAAWLVEHQVLVGASSRPLVAIPGAGGAGLDLPRVAIAVAIVVAALVTAVSSVRRAVARRREELV